MLLRRVRIVNEKEPERRAPKARESRRRRRRAFGAEHRGAKGAEDRGAVGAENRGAEGAEEGGEGFFLILDHEIAFLAHSGRYILQFSWCPPPHRGRGLGRGLCTLPRNVFFLF